MHAVQDHGHRERVMDCCVNRGFFSDSNHGSQKLRKASHVLPKTKPVRLGPCSPSGNHSPFSHIKVDIERPIFPKPLRESDWDWPQSTEPWRRIRPYGKRQTWDWKTPKGRQGLGPGTHFDYRGDVIASDAKRLRFWSRLRRAPTPLPAHSPGPVGYPDSA